MSERRQAIMTFTDTTRLQVMYELIEENELPVQGVEDFYSELDGQPALCFFLEEEDKNQIIDFMCHAQTINLASTYRFVKRREGSTDVRGAN